MRGLMQIECLYHQTVMGNKTMTRRTGGLDEVNHKPDYWYLVNSDHNGAVFDFNQTKQRNPDHLMRVLCKPRYHLGEVLYMKEPTAIGLGGNRLYLFDHNEADIPQVYRWTNKMFMPASAARVFIQITGISCERLLDISDEDCIAEGIEFEPLCSVRAYRNYIPPFNFFENPKKSFLSLFRFANKLSSKKDTGNPWVFVYTYKLVPKP